MYGQRVITCKNADGDSLTVTEKGFTPFLLAVASGIYDTKNTIYQSQNSMMDGSEYQGSVMNSRNIVLTLKDMGNFDENRDLLDRVFQQGSVGVLTVQDDSHERQIEYYVESVMGSATPQVRVTTISLICPNPYFTDTFDTRCYIANIMPSFQFLHEFESAGEPFSFINTNRIATVVNDTANDNIGLTIVLTARGTVVNPVVTKIQTNESIKVGDSDKPFTMSAGDVVVITTHTGNKDVIHRSGGSSTDVNEYLTEDSVYFQLSRGENSFGYNAGTGVAYLSIEIMYRFSYKRA